MRSRLTEVPPCPLCAGRLAKAAYQGAPLAPYRVVQCAGCGLYLTSPRPAEAEVARIYALDDYFEQSSRDGYDSYGAQEKALRQTFRRLLLNLRKRGLVGHDKRGRLLEVGCGYGYLLDEARDFFQWREGTDYSLRAVERARAVAERVTVGGIEAVSGNDRFDLVVANHVIEHVFNPVKFVQSLAAHLAPGGHLVLSTPDVGSPWRRILGRRWPSFKLPEHLLFFTRATLRRVLTEAGLAHPEEIPYPHAFPLPLVGAKLGLTLPRWTGRWSLWLPRTTVAMAGRLG